MLRVTDLRKDYGDRILFDHANFAVAAGEKVGIVGPNGSGKTTLLKLIAGDTPNRGSISVTGNRTIAFLPQHVLEFGDITVCELLAPQFAEAKARRLDIQERVCSEPNNDQLLLCHEEAYEQLESAGGYAFEAKLDCLLEELGMSAVDLSRRLPHLSGGQLTKLALARVLLQDADILLLDEPTNNLDLPALMWFESALKQCRSACLIVSHDRRLLDEVTQRTLVIDPQSASITDYSGNYTWYCLRRQQEIARQWREYEVQQRKIRRLTQDVREVKQQAHATENSTVNDYLRGRSKKVAAKAKAREHRLNRMIEREQIDKPRAVQHMRLRLEGRAQYDSPLICARDVTFQFAGTTKPLIDGVSFEVIGSLRILLSGSNGAGKTTLLKLITGQLQAQEGTIRCKPTLRISYLPQQQETLLNEQNVLEFFRSQLSANASQKNNALFSDADVRTFLHRFQFAGNQVLEPISKLSRGERTKLLLATFMAINPDLLVLDEPTNHLDLETAELLEEALIQYKGALLVVSHDRYFIERINPHVEWHLTTGSMEQSFIQTT